MFVNLGICSTLGVFLTSLAEYSGWDLGAVGQIGTVNTLGNIVLSVVAIKSLQKLGVRITMLISVLACALHMQFYTFATPGANMPSLIFMYAAGLTASFAITFGTHAACGALIADWFVERREQVTGWVFSGAGFGAAIWVFIAGQLFRYMDYKGCYRVLTVCCLVIGLLALAFLVKDCAKSGQKPLGWERASELEKAASESNSNAAGVDKKTALRSPSFWILVVALLFSCVSGSAFLSYSPSWWQQGGMSSSTAANWTAIYLVLSGFVLMLVGSIFKRFGPSFFTIVVCVAFVLCCVCMLVWAGSPTVMMMVLTVLFGAISYPIMASIPNLIGQSVFGMRDFAAISATLMTAVYAGQFFASPIMAGFLASEGGMALAWKFFAACAVIGMVLILLALRLSPMVRQKQNN